MLNANLKRLQGDQMARQRERGGTAATGVLAIIGSGETSPTVAPIYRRISERIGTISPALVLDTPYAFQENADEITAKLRRYFRGQLGVEPGVVTREELTGTPSAAAARLYAANWLFAGPGSPSHAIRYWRAETFQAAMTGILRRGGCVIFASAAACTVGVFSLPVYEIYKAGVDPHWLDGMDLLALAGLRVVVIPHFDNAEGGTHDTRRCYIGERRMRMLERQLPDDIATLGVDEHTAALIDLAARTLAVSGRGGVTVRRGSLERRWENGSHVRLEELGISSPGGSPGLGSLSPPGPRADLDEQAPPDGLFVRLDQLSGEFERALDAGDIDAMVTTILSTARLGGTLPAPSPTPKVNLEQIYLALGGMVARLSELALKGLRDPAELLGPLVGPLLSLRDQLRKTGSYELADAVRGVLTDVGVEIQDSPTGTDWRLASTR